MRDFRGIGWLLCVVALVLQLALPTIPDSAGIETSGHKTLAAFWTAAGVDWVICSATDPADIQADGQADRRSPDNKPTHHSNDCALCRTLNQLAGGVPAAMPTPPAPAVVFLGFASPYADDPAPGRPHIGPQSRAPPAQV